MGTGRNWRNELRHGIVKCFSTWLPPLLLGGLSTITSMEVRNEEMPPRAAGGTANQDAGIGRRRRAVAVITNTEVSNRENEIPKFKVVTPKGASFTTAGGGYAFEKEALDPIDAEIVEAPANEDEFIAAARTADAIYAKGLPISKKRRMDDA